jgi:adenylate cyclase
MSQQIGRKRSIQLKKVGFIMLGWITIGLLISAYDHFCLTSELSAGPSETYSIARNTIFNVSAAFMGSLLGSIWLVFFVNEKMRDKPYGQTLFLVALSFFVIVAFIAVVLGMLFVKFESGYWPFTNAFSTLRFYHHLGNPLHIKNIVVWGNVVMLTQLGLQVNDKFGQGLLVSFILGRYHKPRKELRIFMFLDLIDSTRIAEELGNEKYYQLIKNFFADITNSIIYNGGKIYQYVGDEVVVSWKFDENKPNHDCLQCYFGIREAIEKRREKYVEQFGMVPDFKAAIHYGEVTAGEIGIIKRDLTFSGDVLNTTARIMGFCRKHQKRLLISGALHGYLSGVDSTFEFTTVGTEELRGKAEEVELVAVSLVNN